MSEVTIAPALDAFGRACVRLEPGSESGGIRPGNPNQGGYHNSRRRLLELGKGGDYSLRYVWDKRGNDTRARAFDWTFPDAQAGRYGTIRKYGNRVRTAYERNDPRLVGWREVLIRTDRGIEGFDFVGRYVRTPDDTHGWHGHFSIMNEFVDDTWPYTNMLSILSGEDPDMANLEDIDKQRIASAEWRLHHLLQLDATAENDPFGGTYDLKLVTFILDLANVVKGIDQRVQQLGGGIDADTFEVVHERVMRRILGEADGATPAPGGGV